MSRGYYRMARGWLDHPGLCGGPFDKRSAWAWLIERAAWKSGAQEVHRYQVPVGRGELVVSERFLAEAWGWKSRGKVRRFLENLKAAGMVKIRKVNGPANGPAITVVTLCNYGEYQARPGEDGPPNGPHADHQTDHQTDQCENAGNPQNILGFPGTEKDERTTKRTTKRAKNRSNSKRDTYFETWWALVPNKISRKKAQAAFEKALKAASAEEIAGGYTRYLANVVHRRKTDFPALSYRGPAVWLNDEGWNDEYPDAEGGAVRPDWADDYDRANAEGRGAEWLAENQATGDAA